MTVTNDTLPLIQYAGNGATTGFSTVFIFQEDVDLTVTLTDAGGNDTLQTIITDYTVSGGDGAVGTVTMNVAPASGTTLTIQRVTPLTQLTDYIANDSFPAESHEAALDKLTLIVQETRETLGRTFTANATSGVTDFTVPAVADQFLAWNSTATALTTVSVINPGSYTFPGSNGILVQTSSGTATNRTITGTASEIAIADGNGISGNPTISLPSSLTFTGKTITGGTFASITLNTPTINGATLTGTISGGTFASPTIQEPTFENNAGATMLTATPVASQVNYLDIKGSATGGEVTLESKGSDAAISLELVPKGNDAIRVRNSDSAYAGAIRFYEAPTNGASSVALTAPSSLAADFTLTLPSAGSGTVAHFSGSQSSGQVLTSNGSGAASWVDLSGGQMDLISSVSPSGAASVEFTDLTSEYIKYIVVIDDLNPTTNAELTLEYSDDNGSSYTGGSNYTYSYTTTTSSNSVTNSNGSSGGIRLTSSIGSGDHLSGEVEILNPSRDANHTPAQFTFSNYTNGSTRELYVGHGNYVATSFAVDAIKFSMTSGNVTANKINLYGLKA